MAFYRYYQTSRHSEWLPLQESEKVYAEAREKGAYGVSVLAVSSIVDEETDRSQLKYRGAFYCDIDNGDIADSIESAQALLKKLEALDVPESAFQFYISGGKGFHLFIHEKAFSTGRARKNLPMIYKHMALRLYVKGMDLQVYCGGRGNVMRLSNVKRDDGTYRIPIGVNSLRELTPSGYRELAANPSIVQESYEGVVTSVALTAIFDKAAEQAQIKQDQVIAPVPDESLLQFRDSPPGCVESLVEGELKNGIQFNQAAFQLAIYLTRSGTSSLDASSLASRLAAKTESSSYSTDRARAEHVDGLISFVERDKNKAFSCAAMKSVVKVAPCKGCPLESHLADTIDEQFEMEERFTGYYMPGKDMPRRITSFTLNPKIVVMQPEDGRMQRHAYILMDVESNGVTLGEVQVNDSCWHSRSNFVRQFAGIGNLKVVGTDHDIQNLKHWVLRDMENLEQQTLVQSAGLHVDKKTATYVEPGVSINRVHVKNTHLLNLSEQELSTMPKIANVAIPKRGDKETSEVLMNLLSSNCPSAVAKILGWVTACHLKPFYMDIYRQFPLMSMWGAAGCGKNTTARAFISLNGVDLGVTPPLSVGGSTAYPLLATACSTTSIPRVFDECNEHQMSRHMNIVLTDILKQSWQAGTVSRGRLARSGEQRNQLGGAADFVPISAPLVTLSEHALTVAAVRDRSVQVLLNVNETRNRRIQMEKGVSPHLDKLVPLAKPLMLRSLQTKRDWLVETHQQLARKVSDVYSIRQAFGLTVTLVGLKIFREVIEEDLQLLPEGTILDLEDQYIIDLNDRTTAMNTLAMPRSEVDRVVEWILEMYAAFIGGEGGLGTLDTKIIPADGKLYIDLAVVYPLMKMRIKRQDDKLPLKEVAQFKALVKQEPYFIGFGSGPDGLNSSQLILDIQGLKDKNVECDIIYL